MCGRFVSASPPDEIATYFGATLADERLLEPSFNVAPTDDVYAVAADAGQRRLDTFHWGLVPGWAEDPSVGSRMINARAETVASRSAFRPAFEARRCIVPADGFYEWKAVPGRAKKQPVYIRSRDGRPLALAGLWERWHPRGRDGDESLHSCTIITTTANALLEPVHDRMPVILPPDVWDLWLAPDTRAADAQALLVPAPTAMMQFHAVSDRVGNVKNDDAQLIEEVDEHETASEAGADQIPGQGSLL